LSDSIGPESLGGGAGGSAPGAFPFFFLPFFFLLLGIRPEVGLTYRVTYQRGSSPPDARYANATCDTASGTGDCASRPLQEQAREYIYRIRAAAGIGSTEEHPCPTRTRLGPLSSYNARRMRQTKAHATKEAPRRRMRQTKTHATEQSGQDECQDAVGRGS
jgi:hypothetical protein